MQKNRWTRRDEAEALKQGWGINKFAPYCLDFYPYIYGRGDIRTERIESSFKSHEDVLAFVVEQACIGEALAIKALRLCVAHNKADYGDYAETVAELERTYGQ